MRSNYDCGNSLGSKFEVMRVSKEGNIQMTHRAANGRGSVERDRSNIIVTLLMFLALSAASSGVRGADGDLLTVIGSGDELRSYST